MSGGYYSQHCHCLTHYVELVAHGSTSLTGTFSTPVCIYLEDKF